MLDLRRLAKIWKLTTSPNPGEAAAARDRARAMVEKVGKTLADVPGLLRGAEAPNAAPTTGSEGFTFYNTNNPDHMAAYEAHQKQWRAARSTKEAPERAEVLSRYGGSKDAVLAWTEQERLLRAAVAEWSVFWEPPQQRWTKSIDGIGLMDLKGPSPRVRKALSDAYPLPTTITAAAAEFEAWEKRDRDLGLALEDTSDTQLDLPAYLRREIVRRLLETGLVATSLDEVLIRQRHLVASQHAEPAIEKAVLRDLETLVSVGRQQAPESDPRVPKRRPSYSGPAKAVQPDMFA